MKPLYDLLHHIVKIHWNFEPEVLFQQYKTSFKKDNTLTLPNTSHPFIITSDFSLIGIGGTLFQVNIKGILDVFTHKFRVFTTY